MERGIKPSKICGNLYFVGTRAVCTHLIDTGEGLIIIDPGCSEDLPVVLSNITELGFCIENIRYIVVTHAHFDHMDSVAELVSICGAKTFIGKDDLPLLTGEVYQYPIKPFKADVLLEDGDTISLGNTTIQCMATPGHTDGTMSYFFDVYEGDKTYRAGLFGGAGLNTLQKEFMLAHNIPFSQRQRMLDSINRLRRERVELFLGNHLGNNKTEEKLNLLPFADVNPFIEHSQEEWCAFLDSRAQKLQQLIEQDC